MKNVVWGTVLGLLAGIGGWLFVRNAMFFATGTQDTPVTITVKDGATTRSIARLLMHDGVIAHEWALRAYLRFVAKNVVLKSGTYTIAPQMTIPDVVTLLASGKGQRRDITVTFPEGWTIAQMAERLTAKGFDGAAFKALALAPPADLRAQFPVLASLPKGASLEGYLFPDTYNFLPEDDARTIITALLKNFEKKFTPAMREHIMQFQQSIHAVVTLASIIEREVHIADERPIVSGIFYNRLRDGIALGSDATLDYIFSKSKIKHTLKETQVDSPYNTYKYAGLPPGPIGNPGVSALRAAVYPQKTEYFYFLNNAKTGETVFSRTYEEHLRNKEHNGL